jgi:hypothetical protein
MYYANTRHARARAHTHTHTHTTHTHTHTHTQTTHLELQPLALLLYGTNFKVNANCRDERGGKLVLAEILEKSKALKN